MMSYVLHVFINPGAFHLELMDAEIKRGCKVQGLYYSTRHTTLKTLDRLYIYSQNSAIRLRRTPLFFLSRIRAAGRKAVSYYKKNVPEMVHAHMLFTDGSIALDFYQAYGTPYVVAVRNMDLNSSFLWKFPRIRRRGLEILGNAARVVFLTESYRDRLLSMIPTHLRDKVMQKSVISANGINDFWHKEALEPRKDILQPVRILTVGDISKNKNQETIVKAIQLLRNEGMLIDYEVVGRVIDQNTLKYLVNFPFITISSFCAKEELRDVYRRSDIFILASLHETFGLVYAEAMSQGLPVVYTRHEGFDRQFLEGYVGYAVDPLSPDEIALSIRRILSNYSTLSENSIEGARRFDWDKIACDYLHTYEEISELTRVPIALACDDHPT